MNYETRELLLGLSYKYKGNWHEMYESLRRKEFVEDSIVEEAIKNTKCNYVTMIDDDKYPQFLKMLRFPPFVLYYYGDISLLYEYERNLSILGCINPKESLKDLIERIIKENKHINIVSTLNHGVNTFALTCALKYGNKPILVLPTGIDLAYPYENRDIYEQIKYKGLVISEFPNTFFPDDEGLKMSNRIVAFISKGIWFPKFDDKTPKNIVFDIALDAGKEIYACPQDIFSDDKFSNRLIRAGANMVIEPSDIALDFHKKI